MLSEEKQETKYTYVHIYSYVKRSSTQNNTYTHTGRTRSEMNLWLPLRRGGRNEVEFSEGSSRLSVNICCYCWGEMAMQIEQNVNVCSF